MVFNHVERNNAVPLLVCNKRSAGAASLDKHRLLSRTACHIHSNATHRRAAMLRELPAATARRREGGATAAGELELGMMKGYAEGMAGLFERECTRESHFTLA